MVAASSRPLSEWVCLALVAEGPTHGWAVAQILAPDGEIGRVWSLSRPLTYRALDQLTTDHMVTRSGVEHARGPARTILTATPNGKRAVRKWLHTPIEHLRDVRTELLCKVLLCGRAGIDPRALLEAQQIAFAPRFDALARRARAKDADVVDRWRHATADAARRFLEGET
jgi:PadR family transcriptional regulator AphA